MRKGSLIVVGTGIRTVGQMTTEAIAWIRKADKVLYGVTDPIGERAILDLNPEAESLSPFYSEQEPRLESYKKMVEHLLSFVRAGKRVCAAFYGHPGVFVNPSHEAIRKARSEGYEARMLPGISAEDCLFADLGVDPADRGCQSFEATDFLIHGRRLDPSSSVVIWQVGVVGDWSFQSSGVYSQAGLPILVDRLTHYYPADHQVVVYEAAIYPGCQPSIQPMPLSQLPAARLSSTSTLYIPPSQPTVSDPQMLQRLGFRS